MKPVPKFYADDVDEKAEQASPEKTKKQPKFSNELGKD